MPEQFTSIRKRLSKARISFGVLALWVFLALFANFLASDNTQSAVSGLIPYSASSIDLANAGAIGPFEDQAVESSYFRHWLGTDELGRDVLAQLIHGGRTALIVGFFSVLISALIGISLGMSAAFLGDEGLKMPKSRSIPLVLTSLCFLSYLCFVVHWSLIDFWQILLIISLFILIVYLVFKLTKGRSNRNDSLPYDLVIGRLIEAMDSLPILFLIISLSAIIRPSIFSVVLIIGIINWAKIARFARAETLKIKHSRYIESAEAIGLKRSQILWRHVLPNAMPTLAVALAFNVAAAILIEATLSYLGVGIGADEASWGAMLAEARRTPFAWWLAVFPGLAIFAVVYACNQIGEALSD